MEPNREAKLEGVRMAMGALDCPICYLPLVPPIYQCGVGHLVCKSCCTRLNKCPLCPRSTFERCFGMERVAEAIEVPCCFAKNGCTKKIPYFNKKEHETACRHGPCLCPEPGCGFRASAATLADHLANRHEWPSTAFNYYKPFDIRLEPGPHMLRAQDGSVFLMNVVAVVAAGESLLGHAISLVCVQPEATEDSTHFGCSLVFSCFRGHHEISTLDAVRCSSLADGLPKDVFCVVPKVPGGAHVVLRTTIDTELAYGDEDKLEDEDDEDKDYDEEDDEEDEDDEEEDDDSD